MAPVKFKSVQKRTLKMDRLLRSDGPNTLASLAEAMGVTQRTVCRDLAYMKEELGLPVEHVYGRGYYYALPVPPLEDMQGLDPRNAPPPPPQRLSARTTAETLEKIHSALYGQKKISVTLTREGESDGAWVLHPHFLSRVASRLILFAYRPDRRELVNIPVEQLEGVTVLPDKFLDPPLSEAKVKEGEGWIRSGSLYKVSLRFASSLAWPGRANSNWRTGRFSKCRGPTPPSVSGRTIWRPCGGWSFSWATPSWSKNPPYSGPCFGSTC